MRVGDFSSEGPGQPATDERADVAAFQPSVDYCA